jgi:hypothetical protein
LEASKPREEKSKKEWESEEKVKVMCYNRREIWDNRDNNRDSVETR